MARIIHVMKQTSELMWHCPACKRSYCLRKDGRKVIMNEGNTSAEHVRKGESVVAALFGSIGARITTEDSDWLDSIGIAADV